MELRGVAITDETMPNLDALQSLERLSFYGTKVSKRWILEFQKRNPACEVIVDGDVKALEAWIQLGDKV